MRFDRAANFEGNVSLPQDASFPLGSLRCDSESKFPTNCTMQTDPSTTAWARAGAPQGQCSHPDDSLAGASAPTCRTGGVRLRCERSAT